MSKKLAWRLVVLTISLSMLASLTAFINMPLTNQADAQGVSVCGQLWDVKYYNDRELGSAGGSRIWVECQFPLATGGLLADFSSPAVPPSEFSASFQRTVSFAQGTYDLSVTAEDGVRVFIGGRLILDEWNLSVGPATYEAGFTIGDNNGRNVAVEFFNGSGGNPRLEVSWELVSEDTQGTVSGGTGTTTSSTNATPTPIPCNNEPGFTEAWSAVFYNDGDFDPSFGGYQTQFETFGLDLAYVFTPSDGVNTLTVDDGWSATFERDVDFQPGGPVTFTMFVDDVGAIYLDGNPIVVSDSVFMSKTYEATVDVPAGTHNIFVEWKDFAAESALQVSWTGVETGGGGDCANFQNQQPDPGDINSPTGVVATVTANVGLNSRDCPELHCNRVAKLDFDTSWAVIGRSADGLWAELIVGDGLVGWSLSEWLAFSGDFAAVPITANDGVTVNPELPDGIPIAAVGNVRVRECPSLRCARITYVPWGTIVNAFGKTQNESWIKIAYEDPELGVVIGWSYTLWYYNANIELPLPDLPVIAE